MDLSDNVHHDCCISRSPNIKAELEKATANEPHSPVTVKDEPSEEFLLILPQQTSDQSDDWPAPRQDEAETWATNQQEEEEENEDEELIIPYIPLGTPEELMETEDEMELLVEVKQEAEDNEDQVMLKVGKTTATSKHRCKICARSIHSQRLYEKHIRECYATARTSSSRTSAKSVLDIYELQIKSEPEKDIEMPSQSVPDVTASPESSTKQKVDYPAWPDFVPEEPIAPEESFIIPSVERAKKVSQRKRESVAMEDPSAVNSKTKRSRTDPGIEGDETEVAHIEKNVSEISELTDTTSGSEPEALLRMPCQPPSCTEFSICSKCTNEFEADLSVAITLRHTICKKCLASIHDLTTVAKEMDSMPIDYGLLQLVSTSVGFSIPDPAILPTTVQSLSADDLHCYKLAKGCIEALALNAGFFSRQLQRKIVMLINCQLVEDEGRTRLMRAARSLGERTVIELIILHQNPSQLSANLWAAVRARGCQFLGSAMQEEVLKLILVALEDGASMCRKALVMFVVQKLKSSFPQASKTSIGHVVQLLYRASCFVITKRDGDSSMMQLQEEFRTYKSLRKEHDAQIVLIAAEAGLRIAPDQWSSLLYGNLGHKADKQQSPQSFGQSIQELMIALQRTGDPANLSALRTHMTNLAAIEASTETNIIPSWKECSEAVESTTLVLNGLVDLVLNHRNRESHDASHMPKYMGSYKISLCRDLSIRGNCPRGANCTFAHSEEEIEHYRSIYSSDHMNPHSYPRLENLANVEYFQNDDSSGFFGSNLLYPF